jgi:hypothetical protein
MVPTWNRIPKAAIFFNQQVHNRLVDDFLSLRQAGFYLSKKDIVQDRLAMNIILLGKESKEMRIDSLRPLWKGFPG